MYMQNNPNYNLVMARYNENYGRMVEFIDRMLSAGDEHWFPDSGAPSFVVSLGKPKSGKMPLYEALYTATFGEIPTKKRTRPKCGESWCVRPDHQKLEHSGRPYARVDTREDLGRFFADFPRVKEMVESYAA
jgi:hypothetical protein